MNNLTEKSEIIICIKQEKIVTTITQCNLLIVHEYVNQHRIEVIHKLMSINKFDKITTTECDRIFSLINIEVNTMFENNFAPNLMSISLCSEFVLHEDPYIVYILYNSAILKDKEYIQYI